jgi:hypothetical protein
VEVVGSSVAACIAFVVVTAGVVAENKYGCRDDWTCECRSGLGSCLLRSWLLLQRNKYGCRDDWTCEYRSGLGSFLLRLLSNGG